MTPRQQIIVVAAVLAIVGAVDFVQRVHVPRQPATRALDAGNQGQPEAPMPLAMARQRLQSWFPPEGPGPQDPTAATQAGAGNSATSVPDRAEIGGRQFVLRGVFDAGPPFAVFDVASRSGGMVEQHRLSVGEEIEGVRVERIAGRSVSLSDGDSTVQLALFIDPAEKVSATKNKR